MASLYTNWTRSNNYNTPATDYDCRYYVDYTTSTNYYTRQSTITSSFGWIVSGGTQSIVWGTSAGVTIGGTTYGPITLGNRSYVGGVDQKTEIGSYSRTFDHDAAGNCAVYIQAFGIDKGTQSLYEYTTNELVVFPNVGGLYATITNYSIINYGIETVRVTWGADVACDAVQYSFNGTDWYTSPDASIYPNFNIYGLTPAVNYNIKIRIKRTDSQLWTESSFFNITTSPISLVVSADNFNDTQNPNLYFTNDSGAQLNVRLEATGLSIRRDGIPNSTSPYNFVLTEAERNQLRAYTPNSNTASIRFTIATLVNGTEKYHNFQDKTLTIINANPIFTNFTYADTNSTTIALTGSNQKIVKGYSNVVATVSVANKAVAQKYATMSKYRFVVGTKQVDANYSSSSNVTMTLNSVDNNVFNVYAIDSRSNSTIKQLSPSTYIDYFNPYFSTPTPIAERTDGIGTETTLTFLGQFFNATFGSVTNNVTLTYKYKKTSDSTYTNGATTLTVTKTGNQFSFTGLIAGDLGASGFDANYSYNIQIKATDSLTNVTYDLILGTGTPNLAIHSDGVGVNKPYDTVLGGDLQVPTSIKIGSSTALKVSDINNTVTSTSTVLPLSANIGKTLNDRITAETNAYLIAKQSANRTWTAGGNTWTTMSSFSNKNITISGSNITVAVSGLYQIKVFAHISGGTVPVRLFTALGFTDGGALCPTSCRSNDIQNMGGTVGIDPLIELNITVPLSAGAIIGVSLYSSSTTTLLGTTAYNQQDGSGITIFKVGEYPV